MNSFSDIATQPIRPKVKQFNESTKAAVRNKIPKEYIPCFVKVTYIYKYKIITAPNDNYFWDKNRCPAYITTVWFGDRLLKARYIGKAFVYRVNEINHVLHNPAYIEKAKQTHSETVKQYGGRIK